MVKSALAPYRGCASINESSDPPWCNSSLDRFTPPPGTERFGKHTTNIRQRSPEVSVFSETPQGIGARSKRAVTFRPLGVDSSIEEFLPLFGLTRIREGEKVVDWLQLRRA